LAWRSRSSLLAESFTASVTVLLTPVAPTLPAQCDGAAATFAASR